MNVAILTVRCVCGWETTGREDDVVVATVAHGQRKHNMTPTREQVLAMAIGTGDIAQNDEPIDEQASGRS